MDERRLAEQFAQTGNLMDLCASEAWLWESAQVEVDCGGNVEAGLALRDYVARLGSPTIEQLQMVKLQSILFTELRAWMESWQLGLSFEATYTEARRLIRHHLQHLSPEQQIWAKSLLTVTEEDLASDQGLSRSRAIAMLSNLLTQDDWQILANTAAQGMAAGVLQMQQLDVVSAKAS
ncbi:hypothetical protein IQ254_15560 [Nodosilinea sp. LEGE 07088]|uniref:hypothetical protein n=1 Tax=Nodosilinea sp. LEGE 07088 TaxID=2777968 RepID=UPI00188151F8|nr:hypothetical protein [Nodosilinea sp. LEGE 07088]MBE9138590.1 hypothetical protein [Nodosilinea sp. LEGE 07088]